MVLSPLYGRGNRDTKKRSNLCEVSRCLNPSLQDPRTCGSFHCPPAAVSSWHYKKLKEIMASLVDWLSLSAQFLFPLSQLRTVGLSSDLVQEGEFDSFPRTAFLKLLEGTSLVVQWLRLCASAMMGTGSIPDWGTKIPHAARHNHKKNIK